MKIMLQTEERFKFNRTFAPVFKTNARYIDIWGGRAAGRSHFGTEYFLFLLTRKTYFRGCFLRNVYGDIRDSLFQDFKDRVETSNFDENDFEINESKMSIRYKPTGNTIISKGFKKSAGNRSAKLKSLAGLTHVLIEEADENNENDVNKLDDSIRTDRIENIQIIFLHNPPSKNHWLIKRFYNLVECGYTDPETGKPEPYYRAIPRQDPDLLSIHTTYHDNIKNLNKKTVAKYESYGDPTSTSYNKDAYFIDVLGLVAEGARGRIYRNWKPISDAFFDSLPYPSYYGLDFGFSNDPAALIEIKSHNNRNFYREIIYETGLTNPPLSAMMARLGVSRKAKIYADPSAAKDIADLKSLGWNIIAADGGQGSILFGIKQVSSQENYATENSRNLWHENEEYKWHLDRDGEPTDEPEDKNNHAKDAIRYGTTSHKGKPNGNKLKVADTTTVTETGGKIETPVNPLDWA